MLKLPRTEFAALLSEAEFTEAVRDFEAAMVAARDALADPCLQTRAKRVHALITYAQVFGCGDLAQDCRRLETAIIDHGNQRDAEEAVRLGISHVLAGAES